MKFSVTDLITLEKENVAVIKIRVTFCATYAILSLGDFLFFIFARLNVRDFFSLFFLRDFFQPGALKTKTTLEWGMNERFETNVEIIVNSF